MSRTVPHIASPARAWPDAGDASRPAAAVVRLLLAVFCLCVPACGVLLHDGRRMETEPGPGWPQPGFAFREAALPMLRATLPVAEGAEYVHDDDECLSCHEGFDERYRDGVHRDLPGGHACEACHGPASKHVDADGEEPGLVRSFQALNPVQRSEVCSACHESNACTPTSHWRSSVHAHAGIACTDCHTIHAEPAGDEAPAPAARGSLGAAAPELCYRCHADMVDLERIAGPHQIGGAGGFQCLDCHDPLGKIRDASRTELCLTCHRTGSPTIAWHSSLHSLAGVACTDCHEPHPRLCEHRGRDIEHAAVRRPQRLPMSVQQPETCYKCHPRMYGLSLQASHHPIEEGKMVCSDCHDAHGQAEKGLREPTVNDVCYRCHGEKQGPFAYDHPPVTEDCAICHEAHGSVNDHLLRQETTFLCLRCHAGHRSDHRQLDGPAAADVQRALYADCTQCHAQVHGSDLINETLRGRGLTR